MNIVTINNDYSYLDSENLELKNKLWQALRFREPGYFHSRAYKQRIWDGYTEFFKKTNGRFLTGLLPEVLYSIKYFKEDFVLNDKRKNFEWLNKSIDVNFLKPIKPEVTLYDYQADLVSQFIKVNRGIIKAPTSAGKTFILISILKCLPPKTPVLFLTKSKDLVEQNYMQMIEWGVKDVGRFYDKYRTPNFITCATTHKATFIGLKKLLPSIKVLIVDEVHECMSDVPIAGYQQMKSAYVRCGISATPFKFAEKDKKHKFNVKGYFGPIVTTSDKKVLTTKSLQEREILSKSKCSIYTIEHPKDIQYEPYLDAVTLGIAQNVYFHQLIQKLARKVKGRTLILVERVLQGEMLKKLLPEANWIYGKDKIEVRKAVINTLRTEENTIAIVMQRIITAGIDVFLHNLINAAGGQAEHSVIQRMGRGLRKANDKEMLNYYDFIFSTNEYLMNHSFNRIKTLRSEGHEVIIKDEIDF